MHAKGGAVVMMGRRMPLQALHMSGSMPWTAHPGVRSPHSPSFPGGPAGGSRRPMSGRGGAGEWEDPWVVLGVKRDASRKEIKAAFRHLAKKHHPDVHAAEGRAEAEKAFKRIHKAYLAATGRERSYYPIIRPGYNVEDKEAQARSMRQSMAALGGIVVGGFAAGYMWLEYLKEEDQKVLDKILITKLHRVENRQWQADFGDEEAQRRIDQRKQKTLQNAVTEASVGSLMWGAPAMAAAGAVKSFAATPRGQQLAINPFVAFQFGTPALLFYVSMAFGMGFYITGVKAISAGGQLREARRQGVDVRRLTEGEERVEKGLEQGERGGGIKA